MTQRPTLALLILMVVLVFLGWHVYRSGSRQPFRAQEIGNQNDNPPIPSPITGTVTNVGANSLTVRVRVLVSEAISTSEVVIPEKSNGGVITYTILVTPETRFTDVEGKITNPSIDDLSAGDQVDIIPLDFGQGKTYTAATVDFYKVQK